MNMWKSVGVLAAASLGALVSQVSDAGAVCTTALFQVNTGAGGLKCCGTSITEACGNLQQSIPGVVTGGQRRISAGKMGGGSGFARTTCFAQSVQKSTLNDTVSDGLNVERLDKTVGQGCHLTDIFKVQRL